MNYFSSLLTKNISLLYNSVCVCVCVCVQKALKLTPASKFPNVSLQIFPCAFTSKAICSVTQAIACVAFRIENVTQAIRNVAFATPNGAFPIQNIAFRIGNAAHPIPSVTPAIQNGTFAIQNATKAIRNVAFRIENAALAIACVTPQTALSIKNHSLTSKTNQNG